MGMPAYRGMAVGSATIFLANVLTAADGLDYVSNMEMEGTPNQQREALMGRPGAVGVGIGLRDGKPTTVFMVEKATPQALAGLPREIEGHPLVVEEVGKVTAH